MCSVLIQVRVVHQSDLCFCNLSLVHPENEHLSVSYCICTPSCLWKLMNPFIPKISLLIFLTVCHGYKIHFVALLFFIDCCKLMFSCYLVLFPIKFCVLHVGKNYILPYIQILAYDFSSENLVLDQMIIFCLIFFKIFTTCLLNTVLILWGEGMSWPHQGVEGLREHSSI